ncbi:rhodanese-like domain-containing protein [Gynuella sunshinyii]|uniref:Rhodanese-related sulfurtransferase n=1 Tax=Gynuella sunshinyii YC6258 TaxID=1445510 RepID=A0A0C5VJ83_9GAMM|nr:rhodanese-like domain-containing protein [Gynuella sunshinyii]AJQ94316.1 rhodanese-related sulfurtransferase [Gynuella sunshinyii YC6258]
MKRRTLLLGWLLLSIVGCSDVAAKELDYQKALIVDVRTLEEWNTGHLRDAKLMPLDQLAEQISRQPINKDQQILLYCRSGNRAGRAQKILEQMGYTQVLNLGGLGQAAETLQQEIIQ